MTKQEYLAFSLPYGLHIRSENIPNRVTGIIGDNVIAVFKSNEYEHPYRISISASKLILRPLSDLTKEIEHKGEKFVPISRIKESQWHLFFRDDITSPLEGLQFSELRKLIEWHFDLFDGIESGEAIDVNTLEINSYK